MATGTVQAEVGDRRLINLTEKAAEIFSERVNTLHDKLTSTWTKVQQTLEETSKWEEKPEHLKKAHASICLAYASYRLVSGEYMAYLHSTRSHEGERLLQRHEADDRLNDEMVTKILEDLEKRRSCLDVDCISTSRRSQISRSHSSRSHGSRSSQTGNSNSSSILKAKARAKAEAAEAGMAYSRRMLLLRKQQAIVGEQKTLSIAKATRQQQEIDADLQLLNEEKHCAEARAEVEALETLDVWEKQLNEIKQEKEDSSERTKKYIEEQLAQMPQLEPIPQQHLESNIPPLEFSNIDFSSQPTVTPIEPPKLNPMATSYVPVSITMANELSKFMLKKDLLFSRLTQFDDSPENYLAWKVGFSNVVTELGVSPAEELDLLLKWLGPESTKYAVSIRSSNISNPAGGVRKIWERLNERFGSPEMIESALKGKLQTFPKLGNKDNKKLYELSDRLMEVLSAMENEKYESLLSYFNSSTGVNPIVQKLPYHLQGKWTHKATKYMKLHNVAYPPFSVFCDFVKEMSTMLNNPSFTYEDTSSNRDNTGKNTKVLSTDRSVRSPKIRSFKTEVEGSKPEKFKGTEKGSKPTCPLHNIDGHSLNSCRTFKSKPLNVRRRFIRDKGLCFKCCETSEHQAKSCKVDVRCEKCGNSSHPTALHMHGGEDGMNSTVNQKDEITSACAKVCGEVKSAGKSCAKIVLVNVYPKDKPGESMKMYALIDDQSNKSLATPEFFNAFNEEKFRDVQYSLSSCAGVVEAAGRRTNPGGFIIMDIGGRCLIDLPCLTECSQIPNVREEIPTPNVVRSHPHLQDISMEIPELDDQSQILLLIGRDLPEAHHVLEQRTGPRGSPYAQRLHLGWVVVGGETCLGKVHSPEQINVKKTFVLKDGRQSVFPPCGNQFTLKDTHNTTYIQHEIGSSVFHQTKDDDKLGLSADDKHFLRTMETEFTKDNRGNWIAPLPFKENRPRLPNNRNMALNRARNMIAGLRRDHTKKEHFLTFMKRMFDNGHAELAPPLASNEESWYLPIFGVYHPKKKDQIRVVFDSSAKCNGLSLNSVLVSGPDLTNDLLGVLMRFRREPVAVSTDIQQMFYEFYVQEEHRNFLRFFWFKDNNPDEELVEYRMCVHVFGNSPSPAIATYGLRKSAESQEEEYGSDVTEFVQKDFYVDDGLASFSTASCAVDLMQRAQKALAAGGNLRLHKIASNSRDVMNAFPKEDLAKDLKDVDISQGGLPLQRSLGLAWNLNSDIFTFVIPDHVGPFTRRGVLSTINSLYDPLGFISPVVVHGRILMRDMMSDTTDWDEPLPVEYKEEWTKWCQSLKKLENIFVPRTYIPVSLTSTVKQEVNIFCDASEKAICAVAYLKAIDVNGEVHVGFIIGKSKVSPKHGHTIPRLELCAAVIAVELAETVSEHLNLPAQHMKFHSDSKVVLGYLNNRVRRFSVYVENRVNRILRSTSADQWNYVATYDNPADLGTRCVLTHMLQDSVWIKGPKSLYTDMSGINIDIDFELQSPEDDIEIRPDVKTLKVSIQPNEELGTIRFERFSQWKSLVRAIMCLKRFARRLASGKNETDSKDATTELRVSTEMLIVRQVQQEVFGKEIERLTTGKALNKDSTILSLNPYLDEEGILRVGGRLNHSDLSVLQKRPILIPGQHHISRLLIHHFHEQVQHQGRHLTEGAIRSSGFWIIGQKRMVSSVIHKCVKCRRLRGSLSHQQMSELPRDRVIPGPPFTSVGVDCFGPWNITLRRTRGGQINSKRWAVMFTCLTTRAVHIEVIEEMSSSSFINALRRFTAIRGKVKVYRSDRGSNFVGSVQDLGVSVEGDGMKSFLSNNDSVWKFNAPHSSHMGGVWERMIGVTRRILDSLLMDIPGGGLTHEILTTFLAEVSAVINSRPLVPVSSDPDNPYPLSPSVLLTQKCDSVVDILVPTDIKDLYRAQWKRVQILAEMFWKRWKSEFLQTLQSRRKWTTEQRDLHVDDVVLLRDKEVARNHWPMGVVTRVIPSEDDKIRKAEVCVISQNGQPAYYTRPVNETVMLVPCDG